MNENYRVTLAHAVSDEEGGISGKPGDQTGRECCLRTYYISGEKEGKSWDSVIRAKEKKRRLMIAENAITGVRNLNLGYSQTDRYSAWNKVAPLGYDLSKLSDPANCDCSQLASICSNYAGYAIPKDTRTANMKARYTANGGFKILTAEKYTKSYGALKKGDLLVRAGHHTAVVANTIYWLKSNLKEGTKGRADDVKALQARLNQIAFAKLVVDGDFGPKTAEVVKQFQLDNCLEADAIVGPKTAEALGMIYGY